MKSAFLDFSSWGGVLRYFDFGGNARVFTSSRISDDFFVIRGVFTPSSFTYMSSLFAN